MLVSTEPGFKLKNKKEKREKQDRHMDGAETEKKQEPSVLSVRRSNSKSDRAAAGSAAETPPKASKKSSTKGEGANSSSALTKLSNRLNFLKERRTQIATELQNMRLGQGRSEKAKGSEAHQSAQNPEKRGTETSQSSQNPDKGAGVEGQTLQNSEKSWKVESRNPDGGRRLEDQHSQPALDRGRSESHGTYNADKPPGLGSQPSTPSRTYSR
ncbi:hypothetical protein SLEP1_g42080 [Rubroshorea leprosula]|uniref:Uncharacterized protein n=2 Tax=Rubroshorea leprosula TaxID=152421 RepID=A0AAV5L8R6_9ROSI|nr:hypothetical protein SLEP1_g42080 [Rubroshorea leprosula]